MTGLTFSRRGAVRLAIVTAVVGLLTSSCSLGARQHQADAVIDAVRHTLAAGPVGGHLVARLGLPRSRLMSTRAPAMAMTPAFSATFRIDDRAHRAELQAPNPKKQGSFLAVLFDDATIRLHRPDAPASEARPWYQLQLDDLGSNSGELTTDSVTDGVSAALTSVLDPRVVFDLGAGALAGSMRDAGTDEIDGVPARHLHGNFDLDTAFKDTRRRAYRGHRLERQDKVLHLLKMKGDVHPGDIWLAPDGRVARLRVSLRIEIDRLNRFDLELEMTPSRTPPPPATPRPGPEATILVDNLLPLERSASTAAPPSLPAGPGASPGAGLTGATNGATGG